MEASQRRQDSCWPTVVRLNLRCRNSLPLMFGQSRRHPRPRFPLFVLAERVNSSVETKESIIHASAS